jgi:hypothetical protein
VKHGGRGKSWIKGKGEREREEDMEREREEDMERRRERTYPGARPDGIVNSQFLPVVIVIEGQVPSKFASAILNHSREAASMPEQEAAPQDAMYSMTGPGISPSTREGTRESRQGEGQMEGRSKRKRRASGRGSGEKGEDSPLCDSGH